MQGTMKIDRKMPVNGLFSPCIFLTESRPPSLDEVIIKFTHNSILSRYHNVLSSNESGFNGVVKFRRRCQM